MFQPSDLTQLKLDLIKGMPRVYKKLVVRLKQEGFVEQNLFDEKKRLQLDKILDDYFSRFLPAQ